ncbi:MULTISPECIES: hypothetical protein [Microvirga]|uniref:hypothetical protein n=1 Tax=Microvirga TaxID=186650 RepID=UPI0021CA8864|nr:MULTISPECIES: hypothetical protein [unclassified Microvirga]
METLPLTWRKAMEQDVSSLSQDLALSGVADVLAVGSGGSYITALLIADAARRVGGRAAEAVTPLEIAAMPERAQGRHVWVVSAGGANADVAAALEAAAQVEPARISVLTNRAGTALTARAADLARTCLHLFEPWEPKDGFLATHSLLMNAVLVARALDPDAVPGTMEEIVPKAGVDILLHDPTGDALRRSTAIIAYDPLLKPAASVLETNLWEAALCNAQLVDLRNFAHGRHVWLHRRAAETVLIGFVSPTGEPLWTTIEAAVPAAIPRVKVQIDSARPGGPISALLAAYELTRGIGQAQGVDPGRPGVAEFGRALYDAQDLARVRPALEPPPVRRKAQASRDAGVPVATTKPIAAAAAAFMSALADTPIDSLVLDYDGTCVWTGHAGTPPGPGIVNALVHLLDRGLRIGFATGRGGSIAEELQSVLPERHWPAITIGYYNGGHIGTLAVPPANGNLPADPSLAAFARALADDEEIARWLDRLGEKPYQLSLVPRRPVSPVALRRLLAQRVDAGRLPNRRMLCSGHTVDVLAEGVSKLNLLATLRSQRVDPQAQSLCIGDSGGWPGNDFELLSAPLSLSVDRVSPDLATCWNLLPGGCSGPDGLLFYLAALSQSGDSWRFQPELLPSR